MAYEVCVCVLLFLVLAGNSDQFRISCSYSSRLFLCALGSYIVVIWENKPTNKPIARYASIIMYIKKKQQK